MPSYRRTLPRIVWGDAFEKTLTFAVPLDGALAYSKPRDGSRVVFATSGVADAWNTGTDQMLRGALRWIPTADETGVTGWDGVAGVRAFLEWARFGNAFRFYSDASAGGYVSVYLDDIDGAPPEGEANNARAVTLTMRSADGVTPFDGY